jgi:hypothetical protein
MRTALIIRVIRVKESKHDGSFQSFFKTESVIVKYLEYPVDQVHSLFCIITKLSGEKIRCLHCFLMSG